MDTILNEVTKLYNTRQKEINRIIKAYEGKLVDATQKMELSYTPKKIAEAYILGVSDGLECAKDIEKSHQREFDSWLAKLGEMS